MDHYSFLRDLLETWRATTDWVKVVSIVAVPGYFAFLIHQVLRHRAEQRAMLAEQPSDDLRVRKLVQAEMCRIVAEWERARLAREAVPPPRPANNGGQARLR